MITKAVPTYQVRIYMSGPIETAKQAIRQYVRVGLCVTIEPTTFLYTGGEESGFIVGLLNYPRFPSEPAVIDAHAEALADALLEATFQDSVLIVSPQKAVWHTKRVEK